MPPSAAALLSALSFYEGAPEEEPVLELFKALLQGPLDPFTRDHTDHVTASTVIASADDARVLLRYHRKLERWLQPGGHVEPEDASVYEAALREAQEETGIHDFDTASGDRILDLDVHDIPGRLILPPHRHYDVRYLLVAPAGARASTFHRTRWFATGDVLREAEPSLTRAVGKAREWLERAPKAVPQLS